MPVQWLLVTKAGVATAEKGPENSTCWDPNILPCVASFLDLFSFLRRCQTDRTRKSSRSLCTSCTLRKSNTSRKHISCHLPQFMQFLSSLVLQSKCIEIVETELSTYSFVSGFTLEVSNRLISNVEFGLTKICSCIL